MDAVESGSETIDILTTLHGLEIPRSRHFGPNMVSAIVDGRYERGEMESGLAAIPDGARILEMGAGSGIVGAAIAKNRHPKAMMSIEANPHLLPEIRTLYTRNGLDGLIDLRHCVVVSAPNPPKTVEFFVGGNFLGSSLFARPDKKTTAVQVPVLPYKELKESFPHDVIVMDIEGGELEFLRHADLSGVNLFLAEFHRGIYGRDGLQECRSLLDRKGFAIDDTIAASGIPVYRRVRPA